MKGVLDNGVIDNSEKVNSTKNIPNSRLECEIRTQYIPKTAETSHPMGLHLPL